MKYLNVILKVGYHGFITLHYGNTLRITEISRIKWKNLGLWMWSSPLGIELCLELLVHFSVRSAYWLFLSSLREYTSEMFDLLHGQLLANVFGNRFISVPSERAIWILPPSGNKLPQFCSKCLAGIVLWNAKSSWVQIFISSELMKNIAWVGQNINQIEQKKDLPKATKLITRRS